MKTLGEIAVAAQKVLPAGWELGVGFCQTGVMVALNHDGETTSWPCDAANVEKCVGAAILYATRYTEGLGRFAAGQKVRVHPHGLAPFEGEIVRVGGPESEMLHGLIKVAYRYGGRPKINWFKCVDCEVLH